MLEIYLAFNQNSTISPVCEALQNSCPGNLQFLTLPFISLFVFLHLFEFNIFFPSFTLYIPSLQSVLVALSDCLFPAALLMAPPNTPE